MCGVGESHPILSKLVPNLPVKTSMPYAQRRLACLCISLDLCWFEELWTIGFLLPEQQLQIMIQSLLAFSLINETDQSLPPVFLIPSCTFSDLLV